MIYTEEGVWENLRLFMGRWGDVRDSAIGLQLTWDEGRSVTEMQITRSQLLSYVVDYVTARRLAGLDEGLVGGLPVPLTDSFGDCFGPQEGSYALLELDGLDLRVVVELP